jgi:hypothetical protein
MKTKKKAKVLIFSISTYPSLLVGNAKLQHEPIHCCGLSIYMYELVVVASSPVLSLSCHGIIVVVVVALKVA